MSAGDIISGFFVLVAFLGFITGCTVSLNHVRSAEVARACIETKMEWRDGSCVSPAVAK